MKVDFVFWQRWLLVVSVAVVVFGLAMALLSGAVVFDVFNNQINPVFWEEGEITGAIRDFQAWVYGVLGATMAGWGVFLVYLARYPFPRKERWAWRGIVAGLALWFVVDTFISWAWGVSFNVAFNVIGLALVALPLVFTRKEFT